MNHLRAAQQSRDKLAVRFEKGRPWVYGMLANRIFVEVKDGLYAEKPITDAAKYRDWIGGDAHALIFFKNASKSSATQTGSVGGTAAPRVLRQ